jgi:hypothetical protein
MTKNTASVELRKLKIFVQFDLVGAASSVYQNNFKRPEKNVPGLYSQNYLRISYDLD